MEMEQSIPKRRHIKIRRRGKKRVRNVGTLRSEDEARREEEEGGGRRKEEGGGGGGEEEEEEEPLHILRGRKISYCEVSKFVPARPSGKGRLKAKQRVVK
jgi:hypothetical protein